jgi:hypothetical protein
MHRYVRISLIVAIFLLVLSCSQDLPVDVPKYDEGREFCSIHYKETYSCKRIYFLNEKTLCKDMGGEVVIGTGSCEE